MPYVEGESLKHRVEREGALPVAEAVRLLREVTDALSYAHRRGIIHRDLKPANVLLEEGHALVTDFGIAKALFAATGGAVQSASLTSTGVVLGTPAYMPPEQAADEEPDHRSDLYALGCLAYDRYDLSNPATRRYLLALLRASVYDRREPAFAPWHGLSLPRPVSKLTNLLDRLADADIAVLKVQLRPDDFTPLYRIIERVADVAQRSPCPALTET
jgi:serine/threonine protein kinase